ncbi:uncharacterized protein G2W53_004854 [Senna tora]|uniref:Uncharacterized protein n=1 Tax=Senna tora TaxID=362788 RepID=A0A834XEJ5_9FABA|nr:uncharacterized protein G2W53_004854 [Senna tora]
MHTKRQPAKVLSPGQAESAEKQNATQCETAQFRKLLRTKLTDQQCWSYGNRLKTEVLEGNHALVHEDEESLYNTTTNHLPDTDFREDFFSF